MYSGFSRKDFPADLGKITFTGAVKEGNNLHATKHEKNISLFFYFILISICLLLLIPFECQYKKCTLCLLQMNRAF